MSFQPARLAAGERYNMMTKSRLGKIVFGSLALAANIARKRTDSPANGTTINHHWILGGPMINAAVGLTF
jgi:hypothetical protein